MYNKLSNTT